MRFFTLTFLFIILTTNLLAQQSDLLVLKKRDLTIETFFAGGYITFKLDNYQWVEGRIKFIRHDSIAIDQMKLKLFVNMWGMVVQDTLKYGALKYSIHEIVAMPVKAQKLGIIKGGGLFIAGGGGYIGLNILNSVINNDNFFTSQNLTRVGIAGLVFLFGKILQWTHPSEVKLGKKYKLEMVYISDAK